MLLLPELETLDRIRLEGDHTYQELGEAIGLSGNTIYKLLKLRRIPHDRSLYKIRRFLSERKARKGRS